jgi:hypothetical protein
MAPPSPRGRDWEGRRQSRPNILSSPQAVGRGNVAKAEDTTTSRLNPPGGSLSLVYHTWAKLLELADRYGVQKEGIEIELRLTQAELASWVGASRESDESCID